MLSQLRDTYSEFRALGAEVFGISVDSHYTQEVFAEQRGLPFEMLSDFNRQAMAAYGIEMEDFNGYHGVARRSIFVVRPDGTVVHADVPTTRGVRPDVAAALAAVRRLASERGA